MLDTVRRIKWRNITGLILFILIILAVVGVASFFSTLIYGDCVEKGSIKACFEISDSRIGRQEAVEITVHVSNNGDTLKDAVITMMPSPHLEALSESSQSISSMAPGDKVTRSFRVSSRNERGEFIINFDIDSDLKSDKELKIKVE